MKKEILYARRSYEIMGACFEVYKTVGNGFTEPIYQDCLEIEFELRNIPVVGQPKIPFVYKGKEIDKHFVPDFVCYDAIILELKAVDKCIQRHESQVLNYLNATKYRLGILANFGHSPKLEYSRLAL